MANRTSFIETHTGAYFDYYNPQADAVNIDDVARALSMQCRFNGLVDCFYSVAEHAVLVYRLVRDAGFPPDICYAALHHDSHEAYLGDVPTPLKKTFGPAWGRMQSRIDDAICDALGIEPEALEHDAVKAADAQALLIEAAVLKTSQGVGPHWDNDTPAAVPWWAMACLSPAEAETTFRFYHEAVRARL